MAVHNSRFVELQALAIFVVGLLLPLFITCLRSSWLCLAAYYLVLTLYVRFHKAGGHLGASYTASPDLSGRVIIVTGCNTGLGRETALRFVQLGGNVILACRNAERTADALAQFQAIAKQRSGQTVEFIRLDLQSFASVRQFVTEFQSKYQKLDILVNNAGVMMCPFELTKDGFENQFQSNHLSHFLLTLLLTPQLKASGNARVVNVSSEGHAYVDDKGTSEAAIASVHDAKTYSPVTAYGVSKMANIQFAYEYNRRCGIAGLPITAYSVHPGAVDTELARHFSSAARVVAAAISRFIGKTPKEGAQSSLFASLSPSAPAGRYVFDCRARQPIGAYPYQHEQVTSLWQRSVTATGLPAENDLPAQ